MSITAKKINYDTSAVTKKQFDEHVKLYTKYVDKTNEITDLLDGDPDRKKANSTYSKYRGLKLGETFAIDGVILHELYFQNMTKEKNSICDKTLEIIKLSFGSYEKFLADLKACAQSARGWCILVYEQRTETFRNILLDAHNVGLICMAFPLLVLDMYEHAYFMDYGTNKDEYIDNFIKSIDWAVVEKRVEKL